LDGSETPIRPAAGTRKLKRLVVSTHDGECVLRITPTPKDVGILLDVVGILSRGVGTAPVSYAE
jgi:hypothetical protein